MKNYSMLSATVFVSLSTGLPSLALQIEFYVGIRTKQLFSEPTPGRERIGTLKIDDLSDETISKKRAVNEPKITKVTEEKIPVESNVRIKQGKDGVFRFETEDADFNFRLGVGVLMSMLHLVMAFIFLIPQVTRLKQINGIPLRIKGQ